MWYFFASGPSGYFTRQWRRWRSSVSLVQLHLVKALAVWLHRNNDILRWFQNALTVTFNWGAYTDPAVGTKLEARAAWLSSRPLWHAATCNAKPYIAWPSLTLLAASINEIFRKKHLRTLQLAQGRSCFSGFGHRSSWKAGPVRPAVDTAVGQVPGGRADGNSVWIGMSWDVLALGDMDMVQDAAAEVRRVAAVVWTYDLIQLGDAWKSWKLDHAQTLWHFIAHHCTDWH